MFMGQYLHNLDEKGRIIIPNKIRESLTPSVVVTIGFENCISLYSVSEWENFQKTLLTLPNNSIEARKHVRLIVGSASLLEFDKQGRINLPSNLIKHANASKECVVVGVLDHVEIWSKEAWEAYSSDAIACMEEIAQKLASKGE